jgi:hypothetical protein
MRDLNGVATNFCLPFQEGNRVSVQGGNFKGSSCPDLFYRSAIMEDVKYKRKIVNSCTFAADKVFALAKLKGKLV